uniref:Uncharacterized protein n=1 Tax=Rhizophora mucronata TaxID=61149 RepID=A0A2P2NK37_RHIMU
MLDEIKRKIQEFQT